MFILDINSEICGCGVKIQEHKSVSSNTQIASNVDKSLKWNEEKNTRSKSTDAYGELEFKNSTGKRAKVVIYTHF